MTSITPKKAIVTICSGYHLPHARILFTSLQKYHPEAALFLCLADKLQPDEKLKIEGVEVIPVEELAIENFADFAFRYNAREFSRVVKPFVMQNLIINRGFEEVVYLDPNIELFAPISPVFDAFAGGADFVITPYITKPADAIALKAGIYNLGFIAIKNSLDGISFLYWWGKQLRFQDGYWQNEGIFVDEKSVELLPIFYDNVAILYDPGLNVGYWNLAQRELSKNDEEWTIDGLPLRFFHFEGIDLEAKDNLIPALQEIISRYINKLKDFGFDNITNTEYSYGRFNNGIAIADIMRRCYRNVKDCFLENPFDSFADYLNKPSLSSISDSPWLITNLMYYFWRERELQQEFDLNYSETRYSYSLWFVSHAPSYGIDTYFINPVLDNISHYHAKRTKFNPLKRDSASADVCVIGYLKAETGVGHAGKMVASSFCESGVNTQGYNLTVNIIARQAETDIDPIVTDEIDSLVEVYNVNAQELGAIAEYLRDKTNKDAYKINMPFWELSKFPKAWVDNYRDIDEVWTPSRFVQAAVQTAMSLPVIWMPPAVTLDRFTVRDRSYFKLPDRTFLFHFNFDFTSYATRKNAIAGIKAYRLAFGNFPNSIPTALVIKTRGYDPDGKNLQKLIDLTADEPDIYILNEEMAYNDAMALMNCCDCYLSLHRAEGFGYTPAEAMLLGKPAIATDYSGTKDFIDSTTGFPVNYRLISVKENEYPFWQSQQWADPDVEHAAWLMRKIVADLTHTKKVSLAGKQKILTEYSPLHIGQLYKQRLQQIGIIK